MVLAILSACPIIIIATTRQHEPKKKSKHIHKNKMKSQEIVDVKSVEGNLGLVIVIACIALGAFFFAVLAFIPKRVWDLNIYVSGLP